MVVENIIWRIQFWVRMMALLFTDYVKHSPENMHLNTWSQAILAGDTPFGSGFSLEDGVCLESY